MRVYPDSKFIMEQIEKRNMSQEALSEEWHIPRQSITRIKKGRRVEVVPTLTNIAKGLEIDVGRLILEQPSKPSPLLGHRLCDRISEMGLWLDLLEAVRSCVILGGASAQLSDSESPLTLAPLETKLIKSGQAKNSTTPADVKALQSVIREVDLRLRPIADKLDCAVSYLVEELMDHEDDLTPYLNEAARHVRRRGQFFSVQINIVRAIADPLDGSMNHKRGIPLFCSAVALLIDDQPRVSAIYHPTHNIVYSALLPGPYDKPEKNALATEYDIGNRRGVNLINPTSRQPLTDLLTEGVALHLPRHDASKRQEMISHLDAIAEHVDSIYMLNAGIPAMVLVAKGGLAAFANPMTNLHDIAAGEVLCRATGCLVTDWNGKPIRYQELEIDQEGKPNPKTSVLVARKGAQETFLKLFRSKG